MNGETQDRSGPRKGIWGAIREQLRLAGVDLDAICAAGEQACPVKVVCVPPDLATSLQEMGETPRGQTVMVRLDTETVRTLDAWTETGYVKSRSEAAALFIREGLKVRAVELEQLREVLSEVGAAKEKLKQKAREVFGEEQAPQ